MLFLFGSLPSTFKLLFASLFLISKDIIQILLYTCRKMGRGSERISLLGRVFSEVQVTKRLVFISLFFGGEGERRERTMGACVSSTVVLEGGYTSVSVQKGLLIPCCFVWPSVNSNEV